MSLTSVFFFLDYNYKYICLFQFFSVSISFWRVPIAVTLSSLMSFFPAMANLFLIPLIVLHLRHCSFGL